MTALAALLVGTGLFLVVVAMRAKSTRRVKDLRAVLETFESAPGGNVQATDELRAALARTGRMAEKALGGSGLLSRVRSTLARSDWTLSPGEFLAVSVGAGVAAGLLGLAAGSLLLAVLLLAVGLAAPYGLVSRSVSRRRTRFEDQLPDVLDLLAASLESGAGIAQALELVVAEAEDPAASEFGRVLNATRLGATLVDGLEEMAERLDSRDLVYTVRAIAVQQRTGGRLAEVLHIVAEFMRARFELKRELQALTAEGRISAYILGALPFGLAGFMALTSPDYLRPLYTTAAGLMMIAVAGVLMLVSFGMIRKIIRIEV